MKYCLHFNTLTTYGIQHHHCMAQFQIHLPQSILRFQQDLQLNIFGLSGGNLRDCLFRDILQSNVPTLPIQASMLKLI